MCPSYCHLLFRYLLDFKWSLQVRKTLKKCSYTKIIYSSSTHCILKVIAFTVTGCVQCCHANTCPDTQYKMILRPSQKQPSSHLHSFLQELALQNDRFHFYHSDYFQRKCDSRMNSLTQESESAHNGQFLWKKTVRRKKRGYLREGSLMNSVNLAKDPIMWHTVFGTNTSPLFPVPLLVLNS